MFKRYPTPTVTSLFVTTVMYKLIGMPTFGVSIVMLGQAPLPTPLQYHTANADSNQSMEFKGHGLTHLPEGAWRRLPAVTGQV